MGDDVQRQHEVVATSMIITVVVVVLSQHWLVALRKFVADKVRT